MESVMRGREGAWVGWAGEAGDAPDPFVEDDMYLRPVALSEDEVAHYYEGFSNDTLWPIYHDVIVPATFHRFWFTAYEAVNRRFAEAVCEVAAKGATVWVHDYQLQLAPAMVRELRPDVRIGWFDHIPFPPVELFAQLPWRRAIQTDRKSTRMNSSHPSISYAVFCLKKKKQSVRQARPAADARCHRGPEGAHLSQPPSALPARAVLPIICRARTSAVSTTLPQHLCNQ